MSCFTGDESVEPLCFVGLAVVCVLGVDTFYVLRHALLPKFLADVF